MYLIFIQLEPDFGHSAPIAYALAKRHRGEVMMICTNVVWRIEDDYRLRFLRETCGVQTHYIHKVDEKRFLALDFIDTLLRMPRWMLRLIPWFLWDLFYYRVTGSVVKTDWAKSFFQSVGAHCIIIDAVQPRKNCTAINSAATALRIPLVRIQTANSVLKLSADAQSDCSGADHTIVPHTLSNIYDASDPRLKILGCMRYCEEWQKINSGLLTEAFPESALPRHAGKVNVLIFGWLGRDFVQSHPAVRRIKALDYVTVIFKPRPRTTSPRKVYESGFSHYPSARLIQWADVVVSSITSVVLDVLYYGKPFIYPKYIAPDNAATFEDYKACWSVENEQELVDALAALREHPDALPYSDQNVREFFRDAVYSGDINHDVLGGYADFLESL